MSVGARTALVRAADENQVRAFQLLVPHASSPNAATATFGEVVAVVTATPSAFFNPIIVAGDSASEADVRAAVTFANERGVRPSLQVRTDLEPAAAVVAGELDYVRAEPPTPGLALGPVPTTIPVAPPELEIETAIDQAGVERWFASADTMRPFIPASFGLDPDVRLVVGAVDGVPVTNAAAVRSDGAIGIYAVGTTESVRRRGYGAAITWAAIQAGREAWGDAPAILQSSEMGLGVYRSMGFREICRYAIWYPAPAVPG